MGNKYYESERSDPSHKVNRYYESPHNDLEIVDELERLKPIPPAWDAWLRFRRSNPPSPEELKAQENYFKFQQELAAKNKSVEDRSQLLDTCEESDQGAIHQHSETRIEDSKRS